MSIASEVKKGKNMFGIDDVSVALAFIALIASVVVSVLYGIINWNRDGGQDR